jgi:hypothetical protein
VQNGAKRHVMYCPAHPEMDGDSYWNFATNVFRGYRLRHDLRRHGDFGSHQ